MKYLPRAFCALLVATCVLQAQEKDDEENSDYIDSSPDFSDLIIYVPKFTVGIGFRAMSGVKSSFSGSANFGLKTEKPGDVGTNLAHGYHDGYVLQDTQSISNSGDYSEPPANSYQTTNWLYRDSSQIVSDMTGTFVAMHTYQADLETGSFSKDTKGLFGVEVVGTREMGKIMNSRVTWQLTFGFGINDISAKSATETTGTLTTTTDIYKLTSGSAGPTVDTVASGTYLDNTVLQRTTSTSPVTVKQQWRLSGAYMTFRAGPTVTIPVFSRFSASFSAGPVLVYSGTNYRVTESFLPETGDEIVENPGDGASEILPGYYVDANVQYGFTDNSGFYVGAVYQSSGHYTQRIETWDHSSKYATRVDLSSLQGLRAGFAVKF
jgi:hypothetical protein